MMIGKRVVYKAHVCINKVCGKIYHYHIMTDFYVKIFE